LAFHCASAALRLRTSVPIPNSNQLTDSLILDAWLPVPAMAKSDPGMGLDVHLYQFRHVDTDAILKLWRFSEEPWAYEAFERWRALPESERGIFPTEKDRAESRDKLRAKARELGLPEAIVEDENFGRINIAFTSKLHPPWMVGDWYSMSTTRTMMKEFTGRELDDVFPEVKNGSRLFRPDWLEAKKRLTEILESLRKLEPMQLERFETGLSKSIDNHLSQIGVMLETIDYVLSSDNRNEFLLLWSD
jgi:hypothetical protein